MKKYLTNASVVLLCLGFLFGSQALTGQAQAEEKITVLTPLGSPPSIKLKSMAPRKGDLDGKTVYIVDNGYPNSDVLLTEMEAWFKREMPGTNAIYKRKQAMGGFEGVDPALWAEIKEKGDAVVIGLGH